MYKVLVFAGTTEGYEICRFLADHKIETKGFVATEYGSKSLTENEFQSSIFHPPNKSWDTTHHADIQMYITISLSIYIT